MGKQKLRKSEFDGTKAVQAVQELFEAEVMRLANMIKAYAEEQVAAAKARAASDTHFQITPEEVCRQAVKPDAFKSWLASQTFLEQQNKESISFYTSFFQTQLCVDFLSEEISAGFLGDAAADPET